MSADYSALFGGGNYIFLRYFYIRNPYIDFLYYISPLPGLKEGINASCISGYNLIINNYISEEKKIASGKIIDFFLSKDIQKRNLIKYGKYSAMDNIYEDQELCQNIDCKLFKSLQLIERPTHLPIDYDTYSFKFRIYLFEFFYNHAPIKDMLQKIEDIAAIKTIEYSSSIGKIVTILNLTTIVIILSSYGLIFYKSNKFYLRMCDKSSWFIALLGLCIILCYNFTLMGEITELKCNLTMLTPLIGISLFLYPILTNEFINFPEVNKYSEFTKKHQFLVNIGLFAIDILYSGLILCISPYQIETIYVDNSDNYNDCSFKNKGYIVFYIIMYIFKSILLLSIAFLTFIEYNTRIIQKEIKITSFILFFNIFSAILLNVINFIDANKIYIKFLIKISMMSATAIGNYIITIWFRMILEKIKSNNNKYGVKIVKKENEDRKSFQINNNNIVKSNILTRILSYHFNDNNSIVLSSSLNSNINTANSYTNGNVTFNNRSECTSPEVNLYIGVLSESILETDNNK